MALDEVLTREVAAGRRPPTLRIWEWAAPALIIGSFQSLRNEVDTEQARELGVTVGAADHRRRGDVRRALQHDHLLASGRRPADAGHGDRR